MGDPTAFTVTKSWIQLKQVSPNTYVKHLHELPFLITVILKMDLLGRQLFQFFLLKREPQKNHVICSVFLNRKLLKQDLNQIVFFSEPVCLISVISSLNVYYFCLQQYGTVKSFSHFATPCKDSLQPHGLKPARLLCPWNSLDKNTRVGCHSFLQGIFPTQGLNLGLLHCRQILYCLKHQRSPKHVWFSRNNLPGVP